MERFFDAPTAHVAGILCIFRDVLVNEARAVVGCSPASWRSASDCISARPGSPLVGRKGEDLPLDRGYDWILAVAMPRRRLQFSALAGAVHGFDRQVIEQYDNFTVR